MRRGGSDRGESLQHGDRLRRYQRSLIDWLNVDRSSNVYVLEFTGRVMNKRVANPKKRVMNRRFRARACHSRVCCSFGTMWWWLAALIAISTWWRSREANGKGIDSEWGLGNMWEWRIWALRMEAGHRACRVRSKSEFEFIIRCGIVSRCSNRTRTAVRCGIPRVWIREARVQVRIAIWFWKSGRKRGNRSSSSSSSAWRKFRRVDWTVELWFGTWTWFYPKWMCDSLFFPKSQTYDCIPMWNNKEGFPIAAFFQSYRLPSSYQ